MKIIQVLLSERVGGAETLAHSLIHEWADRGIESEIVYVDPPGSTKKSPVARMARMVRSLAAVAPIIVAHSAIPSAYARICAPVGALVYSVLHSATDDFRDVQLKLAERLLRSRTKGVIAVSEPQAHRYIARFGSSVPVFTIPNGIGKQFRNEGRTRCEVSAGPRRIGEVARLVPQKNPHLWLQAVSTVVAENPEVFAEWWGPSEDPVFESLIRREAARFGPNIEVKGATSDPLSVYRSLDVLVHAASREAHSVGLLEAAAMGIPIVCSADVAATLPNYLHVARFRTDDPTDLVCMLRALLLNWKHYSSVAQSQARIVAQNHDMASTAQSYLNVINRDLMGWRNGKTMRILKLIGRGP